MPWGCYAYGGETINLRDEVFSRTIRQGIQTKTACCLGINTRQPRRLGSVTLGRPRGCEGNLLDEPLEISG